MNREREITRADYSCFGELVSKNCFGLSTAQVDASPAAEWFWRREFLSLFLGVVFEFILKFQSQRLLKGLGLLVFFCLGVCSIEVLGEYLSRDVSTLFVEWIERKPCW